jgi:predicted nucleic acid-binding protein
MMKLVVDASVVAKWLFAEVDSDKARDIYSQARLHKLSLIAPQILPAEIGSVLFIRILRGLLQPEEAWALYTRFGLASPALHEISTLSSAALELALHYRHSVYDCLYVALAMREQSDLVTADQALVRTFRSVFPWVRLLGEWP